MSPGRCTGIERASDNLMRTGPRRARAVQRFITQAQVLNVAGSDTRLTDGEPRRVRLFLASGRSLSQPSGICVSAERVAEQGQGPSRLDAYGRTFTTMTSSSTDAISSSTWRCGILPIALRRQFRRLLPSRPDSIHCLQSFHSAEVDRPGRMLSGVCAFPWYLAPEPSGLGAPGCRTPRVRRHAAPNAPAIPQPWPSSRPDASRAL